MSIPTFPASIGVLLGNELKGLQSASLRQDKFTYINEHDKHENIQRQQLDAVCRLANSDVSRRSRRETTGGFTLKSGGRLLIGHSGGLIENAALRLHRFFNEPLIPGSALKGIALREAVRRFRSNSMDPATLLHLFGYPTNIEEFDSTICQDRRLRSEFSRSGSVSFLPASPEPGSKWNLVVDVQNPHGGNDYTNPVPSFFLAVEKGAEFRFVVRKTARASDEDIALAEELLKHALFEYGVGAKTAAGYGWFKPDNASSEAVSLTLVTPGFFGGADWKSVQDTDLRIPSLRGMLRWWWRALYRNYLDEQLLLELEKKIWGDTSSSSLIVLRLETLDKSVTVKRFNYKDGNEIRGDFAKAHKISPKSTGLHYLAYGMNEKSGQRFYIEPNARWKLFVSVRHRKWIERAGGKESAISAEDIEDQFFAALSLLCQFGGVGSKARNGFGSLQWDDAWDEGKCFEMAEAFCKKCGLPHSKHSRDYAFVPDDNVVDVEDLPEDAWTALDKLGQAVQRFMQENKHRDEKAVLGLPRKIHGPTDRPLKHQNAYSHKPPEILLPDLKSARNGSQTRFASPAWMHLSRMENGKLRLTMTVFPSAMIRSRKVSDEELDYYVNYIYEQLSEK